MTTGRTSYPGFWVPPLLNALLSAGLLALYAFHTQAHQVSVYALFFTLIALFSSVPWYPTPLWRAMKYFVVLLPPWLLLLTAYIVLQEPPFQKADFFFLAQFTTFFFLQNFFLYMRLDKEPIQAILIGIGAIMPLILTFIWAGVMKEDPYKWPLSEYAAFHFAIVLVVILLNVLSVTNFIMYRQRRSEIMRQTLRKEVLELREIQEVYYLYDNFFQIKQILSDPTLEVEEALRRVMKVLTDMREYNLLQQGAFFLTNPDQKSLRMLVQYNADNLLQTCQRVPIDKCLCGRVLRTGEALYKSCVDHEHDFRPSGMKPHGHYVLPIRWEGEVLGVFTLYIADGAPYSKRTMEFLWMVSNAIAKRLILHRQKAELQEQLREIQEGHKAAAGLMHVLLPHPKRLEAQFPGTQALWFQPTQDIGGDFYFFYEKGPCVYFGVGDAEGHGVSGAILATLLLNELSSIVYTWAEVRPAEVLLALHEGLLRAYGEAEAFFRNGADIAVCQYHREKQVLLYAGARLPLLYRTNGEMKIIEPVPAAIGSERFSGISLQSTEIAVPAGMRLYLMSDGAYSQLGGNDASAQGKFGRRRLYDLLGESAHLSPSEQLAKVQTAIREWQRETPQTDDITLWIMELEKHPEKKSAVLRGVISEIESQK